jgi:hypothetical protein
MGFEIWASWGREVGGVLRYSSERVSWIPSGGLRTSLCRMSIGRHVGCQRTKGKNGQYQRYRIEHTTWKSSGCFAVCQPPFRNKSCKEQFELLLRLWICWLTTLPYITTYSTPRQHRQRGHAMLSFITNAHDPHFLRERANSLENITASRKMSDRKHLLLA